MRFILLLAAAAAFAADSSKVINEGYGDFLLVPGGNFKMGDNFGDGEPRERPVHQVHVDTFYIGKTEVTWGEWQMVRTWAVANGYTDLANIGGGSSDEHPDRWCAP